jgi:hypothetical protein
MAKLFESLGDLLGTSWKHRDVRGRHARAFACRCGNPIFFRNTQCLACGAVLGYLPGDAKLLALDPARAPAPGRCRVATREQIRLDMHEPYRTLLGHFRHEFGHYYWDRLVRDSAHLEPFRALFGDERADYGEALKAA